MRSAYAAGDALSRWRHLLLLCLFAILLPHSIKGSHHAWQIAFLLWLLKLAVSAGVRFRNHSRRRCWRTSYSAEFRRQLSPDPYLSWDRMKIVVPGAGGDRGCAERPSAEAGAHPGVPADSVGSGGGGIHRVAVHLRRGREVSRTLLPGVSARACASLSRRHHHLVDGEQVHTPAEVERIVHGAPAGRIAARRTTCADFRSTRRNVRHHARRQSWSGLGTPALQFTRGKPLKAQGTVGHYVISRSC